MRSAKKQRRGEYAGPHGTLPGLAFTLSEMGRGMRTLIDLLKGSFKWGRQGGHEELLPRPGEKMAAGAGGGGSRTGEEWSDLGCVCGRSSQQSFLMDWKRVGCKRKGVRGVSWVFGLSN